MLVNADRHGAVLRLTLADDATRNSLSEKMLAELKIALDVAEEDNTIAVIVIAAHGKVFSSGHNLKELTAHRADADGGLGYFDKLFHACASVMMHITQHRCVVIAEVDGLASAAGCQLVASCDLAYASPRAGFCTPGVNIGLFCSTPMVPLSRAISSKHAMEMLLTGKVFDSGFAMRAGLVNEIATESDLTRHVMDIAQAIAVKSQTAIRHGKRAFYEQISLPLKEAYALASAVMTRNMMEGAACEGIDAFIAKRAPSWPD